MSSPTNCRHTEDIGCSFSNQFCYSEYRFCEIRYARLQKTDLAEYLRFFTLVRADQESNFLTTNPCTYNVWKGFTGSCHYLLLVLPECEFSSEQMLIMQN